MARATALLALVLATAACGHGSPAREAGEASAPMTRATLYFLTEDGAIPPGVRRDVLERVPPPWAPSPAARSRRS